MKKMHKYLLVALTPIMLMSCSGGKGDNSHGTNTSNGNDKTSEVNRNKIVEDIAIKTTPKTEYVLGEEFSIEGGIIELQYEDGTTGEVPFTDSKVTVSTPDMSTVGVKIVMVDYDGFGAQYSITVKKQTVTLTLDLNYEGAVNPAPIEIEVGEYANRPSNPTRQDFKFIDWCVDKAGTEVFDFSATPIEVNTTVYASWVQEFSVTYDLADGSEPIKVAAALNQPVAMSTAPSVLRQGYEFLGWFNGDERYDFATAITTSINLTAKWAEIGSKTAYKFTVDFNAGDSYAPIQYYVADGSKTFEPSVPQIEGKEFLGWYDAKTGNNKFDFTKAITADTTVYARYKVDFYTVNFKYIANGEEVIFKTQTVQPGAKAKKVIQLPRVENYRFDGTWYTDKTYAQEFDFNMVIDADYDLYMKALYRNVFEAEYTNIDDNKQGVGSSDSFTGLKLIFEDNGTAAASNGYWVSGLYNNGSFIEFIIYSEKDFNDGVLEMSLSAEWADMYLAPQNVTIGEQSFFAFEIASYKGLVDGEGMIQTDAAGYAKVDESTKATVDYQPIALTGAITFGESAYNKRPFDAHIMTDSFGLHKGWNVVKLTVRNSECPFDGTMNAYAPMIDYLAIYTDSTLSWNPKTENVADWEKINFAPNKH